ncbi:hypothetical protein [Actinophytocola oryzae]|uniref:Uncharacterized protein n=1 Tax=Actinophytocola oryzae TaxID=502181 RepID=A0A4R7USA9_9PSEU|nr:hypothetical protein [Actinophytocola oryzae]TDV38653.1 hypothetical protein CLV71_12638 [Actinophytocola oryzae]
MNDRLGTQHISALFALMGAAREITNTELQELAGFRIDGQLRRTLNERHLVTSTRQGNRPFVHELTDAGWKRCEAELAGERPEGSGHLGGAFYLVLDGIGRYLRRDNKILADVFQPDAGEGDPGPTQSDPVTDATIATLYRQLADKQGDWVRLAQLRPLLNGADRTDVDKLLKTMSKAGRAHLAPNPDRKSVTTADREAAIRIGGEDNHLLVVERS